MADVEWKKPTRWEFWKVENGVRVRCRQDDPEAHIMALVNVPEPKKE